MSTHTSYLRLAIRKAIKTNPWSQGLFAASLITLTLPTFSSELPVIEPFVNTSNLRQGEKVNAIPTSLTINKPKFDRVNKSIILSAFVDSNSVVNIGNVTFTIKQNETIIGQPIVSEVKNGYTKVDYVFPINNPTEPYTIEADYSGEYDFIEKTLMYWPLSHMIAPKEDALRV